MKKRFPKYRSPVCEHCQQTTHYAMPLSKGIAMIVLSVANAVRNTNENKVHLLKSSVQSPKQGGFDDYYDMIASGYMTFRMVCNATFAVRHGLIRPIKNGSGEYLLTRKGAKFIRNEPVSRIAIIEKANHRNVGYHFGDENVVTIKELLKKDDEFWSGEYAKISKAAAFQNDEMFDEYDVDDVEPEAVERAKPKVDRF